MGHPGAKLDRPVEFLRILELGLQSKPHETALVSLERKWSWRELEQASARLAREYLAMGLEPGDRVASLMPNRGVLLVHYLACLRAGLTATPLNYRYQAPEIDHALEVSGASMLVAHTERDDMLATSKRVAALEFGRISYAAKNGPFPRLEDLMSFEVQRPTCRCRGPRRRRSSFSRRAAPGCRRESPIRTRRSAGLSPAPPPAWRSPRTTCSCPPRRHLTSPHRRLRSPGWLREPASRSRVRSAETNCCR